MRDMPHRTLGERMRAARQRSKLSLDAIGRAVAKEVKRPQGAYSPQAVQQWEKDKTEPDHASLTAFARLTSVNVNWLMTGIAADHLADGNGGFGTSVRAGRIVPKIAVAEAIATPVAYTAEEYVHTHFACSAKSFAIEIFDTRNAPEYLPETHRVVIDPTETPIPGDMVLARINGEPLFGKYTKRKGIEIAALNEDWEPVRLNESRGDRIVGVMTEHAKPRRR